MKKFEIGVQKFPAIHKVGQKFVGKCSFSGDIRTGNHINVANNRLAKVAERSDAAFASPS